MGEALVVESIHKGLEIEFPHLLHFLLLIFGEEFMVVPQHRDVEGEKGLAVSGSR